MSSARVIELYKQLPNPAVKNALELELVGFTNATLLEANAKAASESGVIPCLLDMSEKYVLTAIGIRSAICLVNLAIYPVTHDALLKAGALESALRLLRYLDGNTDDEMDAGLTASFLICRTVGKRESGPGPAAIRGNPKLVQKLAWILQQVLDAGPQGVVIGSQWNPANIMLDVSILATSDANKPLLVAFIPLIVQALELRARGNMRLVKYSVQALSQLFFESACKPQFVKEKARIIAVLQQYAENQDEDTDVAKSAAILRQSIEDMDKPKPKVEEKAGSVRRFSLFGKSKSNTAEAERAPVTDNQHVMISYQWDSAQSVAVAIQAQLAEQKIKTWFDLNDMGPNINDSMAFAVENAKAIIVLFGHKYKESGNCRKECEMADNLGKPMIFVRIEKDYKQEAWLNLIMGKALWIECTALEMVSQAMPQILRRLHQVDASVPVPLHPLPTTAAPASTSAESTSSNEVVTLLHQVLSELATVKQEVLELRAELKAQKGQ